jgi:hypothetical protein
MKEGGTLFEIGLGTSDNKWIWRARGHWLEEFCETREPDWLPLDQDGWIYVGPYKTKQAAERGLQDFQENFEEFLRKKFPDLGIKNVPDPRSMS